MQGQASPRETHIPGKMVSPSAHLSRPLCRPVEPVGPEYGGVEGDTAPRAESLVTGGVRDSG